MRNIILASLLASTVAACGHSGSYQTAVSGVVVSTRVVQRAPLPRAVVARTVAVHPHAQRVDVAYPYWDARDPYQPHLSNYAPNLGEAGNNDGGHSGGHSSDGASSSSNGNGSTY
jgi:hypothetical protein